ncbi:MAG: dual specificity protein phosphatase family protein [Deltaproteobacteria bacterium]|nr:dual specificity protein phosphatase family protein [Deltaproteobacteria bacterium]
MDWFTRRPYEEVRPTRGNGRPSVSWITDSLLVGEYPRVGDIEWLKDEFSITAIQNLQDDEDLRINGIDVVALREACRRYEIKLARTPIRDGSSDDMAARLADALRCLEELLGRKERVYLHCNAGLNRAPTLAIAWLRANGGMSLNEAMAHVKKRRACGPFMTILEAHFGSRDHKPPV